MKKKLLTSILGIFTTLVINAQAPPPPSSSIYPFSDNFESYSGTGGALTNTPTLWTQSSASSTFTAYSTHGTSSSKGLTKAFYTFSNNAKDSIYTTTIGPLTATTELSFDYRIAEYIAGSPSSSVVPANFSMLVSAAVAIGAFVQTAPLITINSTNHVVSSSFVHKTFSISALPQAIGQNVTIKIWLVSGTGIANDFNVDIDNFNVVDAGTVNVEEVMSNKVALQTNMLNRSIKLLSENQITNITILSIDGKEIYNNKTYIVGSDMNLPTAGIFIIQYTANGIVERKKFILQ